MPSPSPSPWSIGYTKEGRSGPAVGHGSPGLVSASSQGLASIPPNSDRDRPSGFSFDNGSQNPPSYTHILIRL